MAIALAGGVARLAPILARAGQVARSPAGIIGLSGAAGLAGSFAGEGLANGAAQSDIDGFVMSRRNVRVMVNPATGQVVLVPGERKKRGRRGGRRMSQVERDVLRSAADMNRIAGFAMLANAMGGGRA